jgi:hypothetical protein
MMKKDPVKKGVKRCPNAKNTHTKAASNIVQGSSHKKLFSWIAVFLQNFHFQFSV